MGGGRRLGCALAAMLALAVVAVALALIVAVVLVRRAQDATRRSEPPTATPSATATPAVTATPAATATPATTATGAAPLALTAPTVKRPLRLANIGDSLAGELAWSLEPLARKTGVIAPFSSTVDGSGLSRPEFFDWPAEARRVMREQRPRAVVVTLGTNDFTGLAVDGRFAEFGSDDWRAEYRRRVREVADILVDGGARRIYWLGAPIMQSPELSEDARVVNAAIGEELAAVDEARFVDTLPVFSDAEGRYVAEWRADDGVHFSPAGYERLGSAVMQVIEEEWGIEQ